MKTLMNYGYSQGEELMSINDIMVERIIKLNKTLMPQKLKCAENENNTRKAHSTLAAVIDQLGEMSASAQGLKQPITTSHKLSSSNDIVYLMKDEDANSGKGAAIGMLRVGCKHLYLYDAHSASLREQEPICILDFFIQTKYQRGGNGHALFEYMLQDLGTTPHRLAIDGPSPKLSSFMAKHYGIQLQTQSNNFGVASNFFKTSNVDTPVRGTPVATEGPRPELWQVDKKKSLSVARVIHGESAPPSPLHHTYKRQKSTEIRPVHK